MSASLRLFDWDVIKESDNERLHMGKDVPLIVYRAAMYAMHDEICDRFGEEGAQEVLRNAGLRVGQAIAKSELTNRESVGRFVSDMQQMLKNLKIGILRVEDSDPDSGRFVLAIDEDVDCSGLPLMEDSVCYYDEGFIAGILGVFTGKEYTAKEVDCWTTGARVCRFEARPK